MQPYALTVDKFLDHAAKWSGDVEIIEAIAGRIAGQSSYSAVRERSNRMSGALRALGLGRGDRMATLAWNTRQHFELYYAVMGIGVTCHTLNPRLTADHLAVQINDAGDRVLAVSADLEPLTEQLIARCPSVEHVILLDSDSGPVPARDDGPRPRIWPYEALLAREGQPAVWGAFDENEPAGLCYTSGTTGPPKGVVYTHRSNYLHTLRALQADATGLTRADTLLLAVPMFHANGWGMPFAVPAAGARLVLPGRHVDGASLARLMRDARVTVAVGVQTVWLGVVDHLEATGGDLPDLKRVLIGGSTCPDALIARLGKRLGAEVQTSWGMTELSPIGTISPPGEVENTARGSGRPAIGIDLKLTDADGVTLAQQRGVVGHLKVRGASVIDRYFNAATDAVDGEGFFDTGDLAVIDSGGNLTITGRSKDLIKSGGEWINPAEIEAIVGRSPAVALVAVIGRPDAKWGERPLIVVEPRQGEMIDPAVLIASLRGRIADWWVPDRVVAVAAMPLAASGKIDKNKLRADYATGAIEDRRTPR